MIWFAVKLYCCSKPESVVAWRKGSSGLIIMDWAFMHLILVCTYVHHLQCVEILYMYARNTNADIAFCIFKLKIKYERPYVCTKATVNIHRHYLPIWKRYRLCTTELELNLQRSMLWVLFLPMVYIKLFVLKNYSKKKIMST
jgi:hypothetical protein